MYMALWNCIRKIKNLRFGGKNRSLRPVILVLVRGGSVGGSAIVASIQSLQRAFPLVLSQSVSSPHLTRLLIFPSTASSLLSLLPLSATLLCLSLGPYLLFLKRAMQQMRDPCLAVCAAA